MPDHVDDTRPADDGMVLPQHLPRTLRIWTYAVAVVLGFVTLVAPELVSSVLGSDQAPNRVMAGLAFLCSAMALSNLTPTKIGA